MSHRLRVKDGIGERELLLIDRIVVGRDPQCDISDADGQMSRRHAEFAVTDRGVVVRDLNSRNGMLVNGKKLLEAVLHPGDVVQVANLAVTFLTSSAEPVAVSMPTAAVVPPRPAPAHAAGKSRRGDEGHPVLPFRASPEDDDRTGLMSADQVAEAAVASLPGRAAKDADRNRRTEEAPGEPATVQAAPESFPVPRDPDRSSQPPWPSRAATPAPLAAAPALVEEARAPITGVTGAGWTASLTWQVATLAISSFLVGTLSALPWRAAPVGSAPLVAAMVLLVPLVALLAALGLGLWVAARVRRATLSRLERCAGQVRQAMNGEISAVADPLGTGPSADLAGAINEVLVRARRRP